MYDRASDEFPGCATSLPQPRSGLGATRVELQRLLDLLVDRKELTHHEESEAPRG
jgi:hypothetical protein